MNIDVAVKKSWEMKNLVKQVVNKLGYKIERLDSLNSSDSPYCKYSKIKPNIIDLEKLGKMALTIPGMVTPESGKFLYMLCYMQDLEGDVVEIGSWQGRSTTFLARAVKESENGKFYAIDHFKGNPGKEQFYEVNGSINRLKDNFIENISTFGLNDVVNLFDMDNMEAADKLKDTTIRFLFIDGDHSKEGVQKDIQLFFPRLTKGSIVVFDDYFDGFSGLVEAVDEILNSYDVERFFYYRHTLVIKV